MDLARRVLAIAWIVVVATALTGHLAHVPMATLASWFAALALVPCSLLLGHAGSAERLEMPHGFRIAAAIAFIVPLAGALLVEAPGASDETYLFTPYFILMAFLGYRMLVGRGARRVLLTMVASILFWEPFMVFVAMGDPRPTWVPPPPHWTQMASERLLFLSQLVNAALCAIALLAFAPTDPLFPEARAQA